MKGRDTFTRNEVQELRQLIKEKQAADRARQKVVRARMRAMGFYITDFDLDQQGFTVADLDLLISRGTIKLVGAHPIQGGENAPALEHAPNTKSNSPSGTGHRVILDWMGSPVETLADLLKPGLAVVCVGINPSLTSVAAGHYYQGRLGQAFFGRLRRVGLLPSIHGWEDDAAFEGGVGFTDIVKRPTSGAGELSTGEFQYGQRLLTGKLERFSPRLAVFTFKRAAVAMFGPFEGSGFVSGLSIGSTRVFVMPSPYGRKVDVERQLELLASDLGYR